MIIENAGPKVAPEDIDAIEMALGAKLLPAYREFLSTYNGGAPSPDTVDVPALPGTPTDVQVFFGIGRQAESSNLSWNLDLIARRSVGMAVLPIACDSGGNLFCLRVEDGVTGQVVFCDLETSDCRVYAVAPSFECFLESLRDFEH